jgi:hypothetical protein
MVTFTDEEERVLDRCIQLLRGEGSSFASIVETQVLDLKKLAEIVDRAPSPKTDLLHEQDSRSVETLVRKLSDRGLEHIVNLPTKAVLGHGFTVMKLHVFGLLSKLSRTLDSLSESREEIEKEYNDLLFTIMAEDLYTSLVSKEDSNETWVHDAAHELITMWDMRTSGYLETFALAIRELWHVRHAIVPVLGTLLGTMEVMRLNVMLPPVWLDFMANSANSEGVVDALEEFIFDLSYEELAILRDRMERESISVIDRNAAWLMLGKHESPAVEANAALALYNSYMDRQEKAKERIIKGSRGPKRSLEEYFVIYLLSSDLHTPDYSRYDT